MPSLLTKVFVFSILLLLVVLMSFLLVNIPKAREGDMPDNPLQLEVYGEYAHIGPLKAGNLTLEDLELEAETFSLESLIND